MWEGKVQTTLSSLYKEAMKSKNQTPILELHSYLKTRKGRINYKAYRAKGLFIGSRAIKSVIKNVIQHRLKLMGMKWNVSNINWIAHLRNHDTTLSQCLLCTYVYTMMKGIGHRFIPNNRFTAAKHSRRSDCALKRLKCL